MNEMETRAMTAEEVMAMDATFEERDIAVITEEINFFKRQAGSAILEIGKRLMEAKEQLPHGEWLPWLEREVEFSERSAQQYMRLWKEYGKSAIVADLGCAKALVLLGLPPAEREDFVEETHCVNGEEKTAAEMTRRELEAVIAERNAERERAKRCAEEADAAKKEADAAREEAEDARDEAKELEEQLEDARDEMREAERRLGDALRELQRLTERPVEVAVEKVDATQEQLQAARREAEEASAARVAELEAHLKALQAREKEAQAAAERAKDAAQSYKAEAEAAKKAAVMAESGDAARFKVLFDETIGHVNRMAALLREMPEGQREKMQRAMLALSDEVRKAAN